MIHSFQANAKLGTAKLTKCVLVSLSQTLYKLIILYNVTTLRCRSRWLGLEKDHSLD